MKLKLLALVAGVAAVVIIATAAKGQVRINEMGITSPEMATWFQQHAGSQDIARIDHPSDINLISGLTVGRKMVIFKSAAQIQQFLASNANAIDIVGYNLEPGQQHDPAELANPVAAAQAVRKIADQHGKQVAIGLTKSLTNQYGAAMAPYANLWILQVQKAQNDHQQVQQWVIPMVKALKQANPNLIIFVQIRTDSDPASLRQLVDSLGTHVSILTQRSDVQDAINVASAFFGGQPASPQSQTSSSRPARLYGDRLRSKDGKWLLPVATLHLGSNERDHLNRGSVQAWDLVAPSGSPVFPIADGIVEYAGCDNRGGYGCWTYIEHAGGVKTIMGHCTQGSMMVKAGQQVSQWDVVCTVGMTGMTSFGPHTHLEIHKPGGGRYNIGDFWDANAMQYQKLGNAASKEVITDIGITDGNGAVAVSGQQPPQQQATTRPVTRLDHLYELLHNLQPNVVATVAVAIFAILCLLWWLGGLFEKLLAGSIGTTLAVVVLMLWLLAPVGVEPVNATQQTAVSGSATWQQAYTFMRRWEGARCVHDPVRTLKGITQSTYDAWRMSQGLGHADVCTSLTEQQAEAIYYQRYWLASGADKLSPATAIAIFDHAVNAGVGAAQGILAQCGDNANCVINARYADYKTKGNCAQYCRAWFNRVNDLVAYLKKGSQS